MSDVKRTCDNPNHSCGCVCSPPVPADAKRMTPEERAENILGEICQYIQDSKEQERYFKSIRKCLEHEIQQACDEAITEDRKLWDAQHEMDLKLHSKEAYEKGFSDAREKAANWVMIQAEDEWEEYLERNAGIRTLLSFDEFCADHIRALEKDKPQ